MSEPFDELRSAIHKYDDCPNPRTRAIALEAAHRFVHAVEQAGAAIEHMRERVTPTAEALANLLESTVADDEPRCICGHKMQSEHHGNQSGSRACDHCSCPAGRVF